MNHTNHEHPTENDTNSTLSSSNKTLQDSLSDQLHHVDVAAHADYFHTQSISMMLRASPRHVLYYFWLHFSKKMFISAVLMLSMMTFHVWVIVSIIIGGTVGYFTLGNSDRRFAGSHSRFYEENKL